MRGYPRGLKNRQDFENLLSMSEHREQALKELEAIRDLDDSTIEVDETPVGAKPEERVIKIVENPMPLYKQLGFADKDAIVATVALAQGEVVEPAVEQVKEGAR